MMVEAQRSLVQVVLVVAGAVAEESAWFLWYLVPLAILVLGTVTWWLLVPRRPARTRAEPEGSEAKPDDALPGGAGTGPHGDRLKPSSTAVFLIQVWRDG